MTLLIFNLPDFVGCDTGTL